MFLIQNLTPPKKAANLTWPCLALHHLHSQQWHRHSLAVQPLAHRSVSALLPPIENHWNVSKTSTMAFPSHVHGQLASDFYCSPAKSQLQFQFVEHVDPVWLCRYAFLPPKLDSTFRLCSGYATMRFCGQHGWMIQIFDHCHTLLLHILRRCYMCIMYKIPIHIRTCIYIYIHHMHIHIHVHAHIVQYSTYLMIIILGLSVSYLDWNQSRDIAFLPALKGHRIENKRNV